LVASHAERLVCRVGREFGQRWSCQGDQVVANKAASTVPVELPGAWEARSEQRICGYLHTKYLSLTGENKKGKVLTNLSAAA